MPRGGRRQTAGSVDRPVSIAYDAAFATLRTQLCRIRRCREQRCDARWRACTVAASVLRYAFYFFATHSFMLPCLPGLLMTACCLLRRNVAARRILNHTTHMLMPPPNLPHAHSTNDALTTVLPAYACRVMAVTCIRQKLVITAVTDGHFCYHSPPPTPLLQHTCDMTLWHILQLCRPSHWLPTLPGLHYAIHCILCSNVPHIQEHGTHAHDCGAWPRARSRRQMTGGTTQAGRDGLQHPHGSNLAQQ